MPLNLLNFRPLRIRLPVRYLNLIRLRQRMLRWGLALLVVVGLGLVREPILYGLGQVLRAGDAPQPADAIYVLAGGAYDRGCYGAKLLGRGLAPRLICTGELIHPITQTLGRPMAEAALTQRRAHACGAPASATQTLPRGTSTYAECRAILRHARRQDWETIIIVSHRLHTRRIRYVVHDLLPRRGAVRVQLAGAPHSGFDADHWWRHEGGLIFVNNEYLKLLYYWWRYS